MGPVLISGDLVHSRENWRRRLVPSLNWNAARTQESLEKAAQLVADEGAVLWVQHDLEQYTGLRRGRAYYE
jgi:N-acyl homoserine lactone hydrolase